MFENIGKTLKVMAMIIWTIGLITIVGIVIFWPPAFILYGFGEIVDKLCEIEKNTRYMQNKITTKETITIAEKEKVDNAARAKREAEEKQKRDALKREVENIKYIDVVCPNCNEKLSFEKGTIEANCLFCDHSFKIDIALSQNDTSALSKAKFSTINENTIICSNCHFEQPAGRTMCWKCGIDFSSEEN